MRFNLSAVACPTAIHVQSSGAKILSSGSRKRMTNQLAEDSDNGISDTCVIR